MAEVPDKPDVRHPPPVPTAAAIPEVVLYGATECHLCDEAKAQLVRCASDPNFPSFRWRVVQIDGQRDLEERYRSEIPVIEINCEKKLRFRLDPARFRRFLDEARNS